MAKLTISKVTNAIRRDDYSGFCITCGLKHSNCEPDARQYPCRKCKTDTVYGAEELLFMIS